MPLVLVFTKDGEFVRQVKLDWSRDAKERGLSQLAVSHVFREVLTSNIRGKWRLLSRIRRRCRRFRRVL
jgi:hypothetical protein